jgi:hypothetical protein
MIKAPPPAAGTTAAMINWRTNGNVEASCLFGRVDGATAGPRYFFSPATAAGNTITGAQTVDYH